MTQAVRKPHTSYTPEFKNEAVKLVTEQGLTVSDAAKHLSMSIKTLSAWVLRYKAGELSSTKRTPNEQELEINRLKKALALAEMERDILKKATAYFVKESQRGMRS